MGFFGYRLFSAHFFIRRFPVGVQQTPFVFHYIKYMQRLRDEPNVTTPNIVNCNCQLRELRMKL